MSESPIRAEVVYRLEKYDDLNMKCGHCNPGWRNAVGNCVLCGCGPSPAHIDFMGLTVINTDVLNTEFPEPCDLRKVIPEPTVWYVDGHGPEKHDPFYSQYATALDLRSCILSGKKPPHLLMERLDRLIRETREKAT